MAAPDRQELLKRKDVLDLVQARSGRTGKEVGAVLTATLEILREALEAEQTVVLPPLGKLIAKRVHPGTEKEKVQYRIVLSKSKGETSDDAA
jgi:nucleoid DNA-binding protein